MYKLRQLPDIQNLSGNLISNRVLDPIQDKLDDIPAFFRDEIPSSIYQYLETFEDLANVAYLHADQIFDITKKQPLTDYHTGNQLQIGRLVKVSDVKKSLCKLFKLDKIDPLHSPWLMAYSFAIAGSLYGTKLRDGKFNEDSSLLMRYQLKRHIATKEVIKRNLQLDPTDHLGLRQAEGYYHFGMIAYWSRVCNDVFSENLARYDEENTLKKLHHGLGLVLKDVKCFTPSYFGYVDVLIYGVVLQWYVTNRVGRGNPLVGVTGFQSLIDSLAKTVKVADNAKLNFPWDIKTQSLTGFFTSTERTGVDLKQICIYINQSYKREAKLNYHQINYLYASEGKRANLTKRQFGVDDLCFILTKINTAPKLKLSFDDMTVEAQKLYFSHLNKTLSGII